MAEKRLIAGVDGGGTTTRAAVANGEGRILGKGTAGPSNYRDSSLEEAVEAVERALAQALENAGAEPGDVGACFWGLAGLSDGETRGRLKEEAKRRELPGSQRLEVDHDLRIALRGALEGEAGVALVAGTGSAAFGMDEAGQRCQCGGWGPLVDDIGSAYWLGLEALKLAVRAQDGRIEMQVELRDAIWRELGLEGKVGRMGSAALRGLSRRDIAGLARLLERFYLAENARVQAIYRLGTEGLANLVEVVARKLALAPPRVALAGSQACSGGPYQGLLEAAIKDRLPRVELVEAKGDGVSGALWEARQLLVR